MTYYLEHKTSDGSYKITWGGGGYEIEKEIYDFFKALQIATKDKNVIK